ncbi:MAG: DUF5606 domain-containing protein [Bacteroidales bacterium]
MKTDLTKILSVAGHPGLYLYLAQSSGGVVVESLVDKQRKWMGPNERMTALSDISIYTEMEDEITLQEILTRMREHLKEGPAPNPRDKATDLPGFFKTVVPEYDKERFYSSHMKKVLDWYNVLQAANALDFLEEEEEVEEAEKPEEAVPEEAPAEKDTSQS